MIYQTNKMKSLQELSKDHLNEAVKDYAENSRQITLAELSNDENLLLKLRIKGQELLDKCSYWSLKVEEDKQFELYGK